MNQNETINRFVDRLLANLPHKCVLIIESQATPKLTLAPLVARRQMFGLGNQGLRFTSQEVYELALIQGITTLSVGEAEQITNTFDGWIAGILLGSRLGYSRFHHPIPLHTERWGESVLDGDHIQILAYITNEVFKHETSTYEFLKKTAILVRLSPEHCNALLEIDNAVERLAHAEQRGLFVVRDRENANARQARDYICHPVLRQLFTEHLRQQSPEDYQALHYRAARILLADHQYGQALMHACQAQEYSFAASIIVEGAPSIVYEEHSEMILHWLEMLPEAIFTQHSQLLLIASNIHLRHGEFTLVPPLLDAADVLLKALPGEEDPHTRAILEAELFITRGHLSFFQGEFQHTQELCQQALELLPPDERKLHIRAYQYIGISLIVGTGQIQEGITQLQQALQMSKSQQDERQVATLHRLVANAYSWIGNHTLAEYHQMRAFQIWEKLKNSQGITYGLTSMGLLKMRQGLIQQAEELLRQALNQARDIFHFKSGEAYALVALGDVYNSLGQYTEALNYLEDGLKLARDCEDRYLICCALCYLALTYLFLGDVQTASFFLNQVVLKEGEKQSFAGCLFYLTQGTVYLSQQDYGQAELVLEHAVDIARRANIQIMYISALLRLATCYLRQNKQYVALQIGQRIIDLNKKGDFDFLLQVEFRRYSELGPFLDQVPETDSAKDKSLPIESVSQEHSTLSKATLEEVQKEQEVFAFQILALGEPQVIFHGIPVTRWRMARAMELFFFLLETGHPLRKEQITIALWPEQDGEQIDSTVRTTIYYLRKALGERSVVFQAGLYSLNLSELGGKIWYDVEVFNELYSQAKQALEDESDDSAASAFKKMLHLYNGDYVQPFYNNWCIFRRDKLRQAYMDAHHQLAFIAWRREDWDNSLHHWQHLLVMDACHETAHYGIMRCYLQQGKRELALRQFQSCSQILREELQTTPKASLQKLYRSIIGESS
ncbi:MAG: tetratricopeptide repeat protein [Ktedonobacteraceae bacterium]